MVPCGISNVRGASNVASATGVRHVLAITLPGDTVIAAFPVGNQGLPARIEGIHAEPGRNGQTLTRCYYIVTIWHPDVAPV